MTDTPKPPSGYASWIDYELRPREAREKWAASVPIAELAALRHERDQALVDLVIAEDIAEGVIDRACLMEDDTLDSLGTSAYADGLRWLAKRGKIEIVSEHGRRVIARAKA